MRNLSLTLCLFLVALGFFTQRSFASEPVDDTYTSVALFIFDRLEADPAFMADFTSDERIDLAGLKYETDGTLRLNNPQTAFLYGINMFDDLRDRRSRVYEGRIHQGMPREFSLGVQSLSEKMPAGYENKGTESAAGLIRETLHYISMGVRMHVRLDELLRMHLDGETDSEYEQEFRDNLRRTMDLSSKDWTAIRDDARRRLEPPGETNGPVLKIADMFGSNLDAVLRNTARQVTLPAFVTKDAAPKQTRTPKAEDVVEKIAEYDLGKNWEGEDVKRQFNLDTGKRLGSTEFGRTFMRQSDELAALNSTTSMDTALAEWEGRDPAADSRRTARNDVPDDGMQSAPDASATETASTDKNPSMLDGLLDSAFKRTQNPQPGEALAATEAAADTTPQATKPVTTETEEDFTTEGTPNVKPGQESAKTPTDTANDRRGDRQDDRQSDRSPWSDRNNRQTGNQNDNDRDSGSNDGWDDSYGSGSGNSSRSGGSGNQGRNRPTTDDDAEKTSPENASSGSESLGGSASGRRPSKTTPTETTSTGDSTETAVTETPVPESTTTPTKETPTPESVTTPVKETTVPESTTTPVKETTVPESVTTPVKETTVPESTTTPVKETTVPESTTTPVKETTVPESTTTPAKETTTPESTTTPAKETTVPESVTTPVKETTVPESTTTPAKETTVPESTTTPAKETTVPESTTTPAKETPTPDTGSPSVSADIPMDEKAVTDTLASINQATELAEASAQNVEKGTQTDDDQKKTAQASKSAVDKFCEAVDKITRELDRITNQLEGLAEVIDAVRELKTAAQEAYDVIEKAGKDLKTVKDMVSTTDEEQKFWSPEKYLQIANAAKITSTAIKDIAAALEKVEAALKKIEAASQKIKKNNWLEDVLKISKSTIALLKSLAGPVQALAKDIEAALSLFDKFKPTVTVGTHAWSASQSATKITHEQAENIAKAMGGRLPTLAEFKEMTKTLVKQSSSYASGNVVYYTSDPKVGWVMLVNDYDFPEYGTEIEMTGNMSYKKKNGDTIRILGKRYVVVRDTSDGAKLITPTTTTPTTTTPTPTPTPTPVPTPTLN